MATALDRWLTDSIATATTGANILQVRQVGQKAPLYGLLHISGTFTGSVQLEASPPSANTWAILSAAITAPGASSVLIPADCDLRFNATALSANGPIVCFLGLAE